MNAELIVVYASLFSIVSFAFKAACRLWMTGKDDASPVLNKSVYALKGVGIFRLARFIGCVALLGASAASAAMSQSWIDAALCASFCYACVLAFVSAARLQVSPAATAHLNALLLIAFGVLAVPDLAPFAMRDRHPTKAENALLWVIIALLFLNGVLIPLITPRVHTPVNLKNPWPASHLNILIGITQLASAAWSSSGSA